MGQRTNLLLQVEGRSGARLNRMYHLQWGYRKYLPMAFLRLLSSRYFKPETCDINLDTKANTMTSSPMRLMRSQYSRARNM